MWSGLAVLAREVSGLGLTWLVQSSVLLALGLAAGRLLRRSGPAVQSGVYRTTLAAVLVCPFASAALGVAGFDGFSLRLPAAATDRVPEAVAPSVRAVHAVAQTINPGVAASRADLTAREEARSVVAPAITRADVMPSAPASESMVVARRPMSVTLRGAAAVGLVVWLLGSTFLVLRLWLGHARMRSLRASAVPAEPGAEALCREVAGQMSVSAPTVWRSPFLFSPCLDGLRRPAILLPDDVGKNLRETFIHELAHLARHDGLWNLLRRWATAGLWVQPLLWVLSRRLEAAAEEVCDDYVVHWGAERADYAGHLLELAGRALPPAASASVGMISLRSMLARRIVRILDTSRVLSTRAGARAVLAMLFFGLAGTVLAGLLGVDGRNKAIAQAAATADDPKREPDDKTIHGQVVTPDGKPKSGATVILARSRRISDGIGDGYASKKHSEIFRKTTGADGRFTFAPETDGQAIAVAPGFGLGYLSADRRIGLTSGDLPINGRLVDLEGRPVAGVKITLEQVWLPAGAPFEEPAATKKSGAPLMKTRATSGARGSAASPFSMSGRLGLHPEGLLSEGIVSDADGRFRIDGLGRDVVAQITLKGVNITHKTFKVVTRDMDRIVDSSREPSFAGLEDSTIYGATCTIPVEPTRPIEGFVRDAQTKKPIAGAIVTAAALSGSTLTIEGLVSTETDADGHYRLIGLPKEGAQGHKLSVYPPVDQPYFITARIEAPAMPGYETVRFDIALKSGISITGKVTDVATGKPVAAAVDYFPMLTNPHAKDYRNFDPNVMSIVVKARYKTDAAGRFRIVGLPGEGVVTAHTDDKTYLGGVGAESIKGRTGQDQLLTYDRIFVKIYQSLRPISVPEGASSFACDLGVDPGGSLRLRLVDESGKPVMHTAVYGRNPEGSDDGDHNLYSENIARIAGLEPGKARTVLIKSHDPKIGAIVTIPPDGPRKDAEMTVTLRPCATIKGRLVDGEGKPATGGIRVELIPTDVTTFRQIPVERAELDSEGRFSCDGLPAGGPYLVLAANRVIYGLGRRMEPETFKPFELAKDMKLEPGQSVDFGTVDVNTGKRIGDAPAAKAATADVPITGRIVTLEGRPIAGVTVKVSGVQGPTTGDLTAWIEGVKKGEPPWTAYSHLGADVKIPESFRREVTTDNDGRFRFEGLGRERVVELTIKGDTVAYTSIDVVTRRTEPIPARGFPDNHGPGAQTVYGSDFIYTAKPGRPVEGMVRDATTKQPIAGISVQSWRFAGSDFVSTRELKAVSDLNGRFRIVGMPKGAGNIVIAVAGDDQPYFMREVSVGDPPGIDPVAVEIELHRGVMITGKITDKSSGKPVAGARLHYMPFLENTFVQGLPEFDKDGNVDGFQERYTTKADGTYQLVGMPGRAIVGVEGVGTTSYRSGAGSETIKGLDKNGFYNTWRNPIPPGRSWPNTLVEINPALGTNNIKVDAQLDPGLTLRIKVVDANGKPVPDAAVANGSQLRAGESTPEAEFTLSSFRPDEVRNVVVRHEGRSLGKVVRLRVGDDARGPVVVTIGPTAAITGRVVDADGNPVPGATVRVDVEPTEGFVHQLANVVAGRDGRFDVLKVPVGCEYGLVAESGTMMKQRLVAFSTAKVKAGQTTDVGEIRFKND